MVLAKQKEGSYLRRVKLFLLPCDAVFPSHSAYQPIGTINRWISSNKFSPRAIADEPSFFGDGSSGILESWSQSALWRI